MFRLTRTRVLGLASVAAVAASCVVAIAVPANAALPPAISTEMVSVTPGGAAIATTTESSVSGDGRYVAFVTSLPVLDGVSSRDVAQVYVRDMVSGAVTLVSRSAAGTRAGDADSGAPSISADGRFVAFISDSNDLVPELTTVTADGQVFVRDLRDGVTRLVTRSLVDSDGADAGADTVVMAADGSHVAFSSRASDLVSGVGGPEQVFVADLTDRSISLASRAAGAGAPADADARVSSISADGSVVAFATAANLTGDDTHGFEQVIVRNMTTSLNELVSRGSTGGGHGYSGQASLSADGQRVAFSSNAPDLLGGPAIATYQVFFRDLDGPVSSTLVSSAWDSDSPGRAQSTEPVISADGGTVVFTSPSPDLTDTPTTGEFQVFHRDLDDRVTKLVSAQQDDPAKAGSGPGIVPAVSADGRYVSFAGSGMGITKDTVDPGSRYIYLRALDYARVDRIGGADRFEVSANASADVLRNGATTAYVASGSVFADALAASAVAGDQSAPVLLVSRDAIPSSVMAELRRLHPARIVILGGPTTISPDTEMLLRSLAPRVERIGGADRYEVAVGLAQQNFGSGGTPVTYIASGQVFPDALSGGAAAGHRHGPTLLVTKDAVPAVVTAELRRSTPGKIVVLGGTATVSDAVVAALRTIAPVTRIGGADRFAVSAAVSEDAFPGGAQTVYIASGAVFPDALSGGAAAVMNKAPVLLVSASAIAPSVAAELTRLHPHRIVLLGGPATVSDAVATQLEDYLPHER